jgi:hypothetical protein
MKLISKLRYLILAFFLISFFALHSAENIKTKSFVELLQESQMVFQKPEGLVEVAVMKNDQMNYEYALKYPDKKFEVRYAIRPLGAMIVQYKENLKNKKPGDVFMDPNVLYPTLFQAIALNVSGGKESYKEDFDKNAIKEEFKADWGSITFFEVGKSYSQEYKYCLMMAIHKDNCADAYIFYLSDDKERLMELAAPAFHSLTFK